MNKCFKKNAIIFLLFLFMLPLLNAVEPGKTKILIVEIMNRGNQYEFSQTYLTEIPAVQFSNQGNYTIEIRSKEDQKLFAMRVDLTPIGINQPALMETLLNRTYHQPVMLPYFHGAYRLVLLGPSNQKIAETRVDGLVHHQPDRQCQPIEDSQCDLLCNRDIQDPDCGINQFLLQETERQFYLAGASILLPNTTSTVTPFQWFGLIATAAVIIGFLLLGRQIQKERLPPSTLE
jgi:hypothetical protein